MCNPACFLEESRVSSPESRAIGRGTRGCAAICLLGSDKVDMLHEPRLPHEAQGEPPITSRPCGGTTADRRRITIHSGDHADRAAIAVREVKGAEPRTESGEPSHEPRAAVGRKRGESRELRGERRGRVCLSHARSGSWNTMPPRVVVSSEDRTSNPNPRRMEWLG